MNPFDQFDTEPKEIPLKKAEGANPFDQFDAPTVDEEKTNAQKIQESAGSTFSRLTTRIKDEVAGLAQDALASESGPTILTESGNKKARQVVEDVRKDYAKQLGFEDQSGHAPTTFSGGGKEGGLITDSNVSVGVQKNALGAVQTAGDALVANADMQVLPGVGDAERKLGTEISQSATKLYKQLDTKKDEGGLGVGQVAGEYGPEVGGGVKAVVKGAKTLATKQGPKFLPRLFMNAKDNAGGAFILGFTNPQGQEVESEVPINQRMMDRFFTALRDASIAGAASGAVDTAIGATGWVSRELGNVFSTWKKTPEAVQQDYARMLVERSQNPDAIESALQQGTNATPLNVTPQDTAQSLAEKFPDVKVPAGQDSVEYFNNLEYKPTSGALLKDTDVGSEVIGTEQAFKLEGDPVLWEQRRANTQAALARFNQLNPKNDKDVVAKFAKQDFDQLRQSYTDLGLLIDGKRQALQNAQNRKILELGADGKTTSSNAAFAQIDALEKKFRTEMNSKIAAILPDNMTFDVAEDLDSIIANTKLGEETLKERSPALRKLIDAEDKMLTKPQYDLLLSDLQSEITKAYKDSNGVVAEALKTARDVFDEGRFKALESVTGGKEAMQQAMAPYYTRFGKLNTEQGLLNTIGSKFIKSGKRGNIDPNTALSNFIKPISSKGAVDGIQSYKRIFDDVPEELERATNNLTDWLSDDLTTALNKGVDYNTWADKYQHVFREFPEVGAKFSPLGQSAGDIRAVQDQLDNLKLERTAAEKEFANTFRGSIYNFTGTGKGKSLDQHVQGIFGGNTFDTKTYNLMMKELKNPGEKEAVIQSLYDYLDNSVLKPTQGLVTSTGTYQHIDPDVLSKFLTGNKDRAKALTELLGQNGVDQLQEIARMGDDLKNLQKVTKAQPGESMSGQNLNPAFIRRLGLIAGNYKGGIVGELITNVFNKSMDLSNNTMAKEAIRDLMANPDKLLAQIKAVRNPTPAQESAIRRFVKSYNLKADVMAATRAGLAKQSEADFDRENDQYTPPEASPTGSAASPDTNETLPVAPTEGQIEGNAGNDTLNSNNDAIIPPVSSSAKLTPIEQTIKTLGGPDGDLLVMIHRNEGSPGASQKTGGNGSARGTFQFIGDTWRRLTDRYGQQDGVQYNDLTKPEAQIKMMKRLVAEHRQHLMRTLRRNPTPKELYALHFLGQRPGTNLILAAENPQYANLPAYKLFPNSSPDNRARFFSAETNQPLTVKEVFDQL